MECRFCLEEGSLTCKLNPLIEPCICKGSVAFVHTECLMRWRNTTIRVDQDIMCPICNSVYKLQILGFNLREEIPEYKGFTSILLYPTILLISSNYIFMVSCAISNVNLAGLSLEDGNVDLRAPYTYLHMALAFIYLATYSRFFCKVRGRARYIETARQFALLPLAHGLLLLTIPQLHVIPASIHHFLLPLYLIKHQEILRIMNSQL
jgi:RING-variant domain